MKGKAAGVLVALAFLITACGGGAAPAQPSQPAPAAASAPASSGNLVPLRFSFSFIPTGNQAPYYAAKARGYYKAQGLDVTLVKGVTPQVGVDALTSGKVDIAEADTAFAVELAQKGAPLKIVAVTLQQDPLGLLYLTKAPITKPTDLYGKTVGTFPGTEAEKFYQAFVSINKLDASKIKTVNVSPNTAVGLLGQGKVDAFTGGGYTFAPPAAAQGLQLGTMLFGDYGVQALANCVVTTDSMLQQHPDEVKRFLYATAQGFAFAQAQPDQAAAYESQVDGLKPEVVAGQLKASLQFLHSKATQGKPWGWSAPEDWQQHLKLMQQWLGLTDPKPASAYYTNDYLPTGPVPAP